MSSTHIPSNTLSLTRDHSSPKDIAGIELSKTPQSAMKEMPKWQQEYKTSFTNIEQLCQTLELNIDQLPISENANKQFPLRVPQSYVARMQKSNPNDPLLLQVLPIADEDNNILGYTNDPVGDLQSIKTPGLLQKYKGRALLLVTSLCAIHCRYCFRRHFPYSSHNPRQDHWNLALEELRQDQSISEVILSGGDPLVLNDLELTKLINQLENIPHLKRLRIHTRLPVVIPNRIDNELLTWIENSHLQIIMVLHINHAQEINNELCQKLTKLNDINCTLLNQSVLLKGVNEDASSLIELSETLFDAGVLPYYLHLLDKVDGAEHFDIAEEMAITLMREVSHQLPGYLVPKLVREISGKKAKQLICY